MAVFLTAGGTFILCYAPHREQSCLLDKVATQGCRGLGPASALVTVEMTLCAWSVFPVACFGIRASLFMGEHRHMCVQTLPLFPHL